VGSSWLPMFRLVYCSGICCTVTPVYKMVLKCFMRAWSWILPGKGRPRLHGDLP
jgi:hypothetical protein